MSKQMNYIPQAHFTIDRIEIRNGIARNPKQLELVSTVLAETQSELHFSRRLNILERTNILSYLVKNLNREVRKESNLKKLGFKFKPMLQPDQKTITIGFEYGKNKCAKVEGIYLQQIDDLVNKIVAQISDPETGRNLFLINFSQEQDSKYKFKELGTNCRI